MLPSLLLLFASLLACEAVLPGAPAPEAAPEPVTVELTNNSDQAWTDMAVSVDGEAACVVEELGPTGTITIKDGTCEVFIPEPEEAEEEAVPVVSTRKSEPAAPTSTALAGSASVTGGIGPARILRVSNNGAQSWTDCTLTLDGKWSYHVSGIPKGTTDATPLAKFRDSSGNIMTRTLTIRSVAATCKEGAGTFSVQ